MSLIQRITGREGKGWTILAATAPIALLVGVYLIAAYDPVARLGLRVDRTRAVELARSFAQERGFPVEGWTASTRLEENRQLRRYLELHPQGSFGPAREALPVTHWRVLLGPPDRNHGFEVRLAPDGRVIGFHRYFPDDAEVSDEGETQSLPAATGDLRRLLGNEASGYRYAGSALENRKGVPQRTFTWRQGFEERPELTLVSRVSVAGGEVSGHERDIEVSSDFLKQNSRIEAGDQQAVVALVLFAMLILILYGIIRFIGRAREQEVPYKRSLVLALLLYVSLMMFALFASDLRWDQDGGLQNRTMQMLIMVPTFAIMAGAIGLAWGASEGDVRERVPGKLTSFDALLGGRFITVNVGRSIVMGLLFSGFVVLGTGIVAAIGARLDDGMGGLSEGTLTFFASRSFVVMIIAGVFSSVAMTPIGALVPVSFLSRWTRSRLILGAALLSFFTLFLVSGALQNFSPWWLAVLYAAIYGGAIVIPFLAADLTAAIVTMMLAGWMTFGVYLYSQPAIASPVHWITLAVATGAILILGVAGLVRGPELTDEDVRPQYARNISERLTLQAELGAAREAQLRFIPKRLPLIPNGSVAAVCKPAREVGGDYYDFFQYPDGRLGIAIADAREEGLSAALSVTMLKGLLLAYVRSNDSSTKSILGKAAKHLENVFGARLPFSFLFLILDPVTGKIEYSRIGSTPLLVHLPSRGDNSEAVMVMPASDNGTSGALALNEGESFVLYSDGVRDAVSSERVRLGDDAVLANVSALHGEHDPESLVQSILGLVERHTRDSDDPGDDLTVVAVTLRAPAGDSMAIAERSA